MARNNVIGRWRKQPDENLRYEIDWTQWLMPGEVLTAAFVDVTENDDGMMEVTDPFFLTGNTSCVYFLKGGTSGHDYKVTHRVLTSSGQVAEREILYEVEDE